MCVKESVGHRVPSLENWGRGFKIFCCMACTCTCTNTLFYTSYMYMYMYMYIDFESVFSLVCWSHAQALGQVSRYLGYRTAHGLLEDHLLATLSDWLEKDQRLDRFPHQLFGPSNQQRFFV